MLSLSRFLPEIFGIFLVLACHRAWLAWFPSWRRWILVSAVLGVSGLVLNVPPVWRLLPPGPVFTWTRGAVILWGILACGTTGAVMLTRWMGRRERPTDPGRRGVLQTAQTAVVAAPALALGYGTFVERRWLKQVEVNVRVPGLPKDLDGVRIAQLSDIHMSSFLSPDELAAAVDMANEFRPHLSVVTGDLITRDGDPLDVLVLTQAPLLAGSVVSARLVGVLQMEDEKGRDEKLIAVPTSKLTPLYDSIKTHADLPPLFCQQVQHFFEHYKDLEKGKWVKILSWDGPDVAQSLVTDAIKRLQENL